MAGESKLDKLIRHMEPELQPGEYVFLSVTETANLDRSRIICEFKEQEGITLILERGYADESGLPYEFVAAWITLKVHSSLEAVGLTAAFSQALAAAGISCNVVAGFYPDHIFVGYGDRELAMETLIKMQTS